MSSIRTNAALIFIVALSLALSHAQQLQRGISVQMAHTTHAVAYAAADSADAWVVAITAEGNLYFGVKPVTPDQLSEEMRATPRQRDARLFIKADERSPFANVETALAAAREVGFEAPVLLTAQSVSSALGSVVPPNGLEVLVSPAPPRATVATVVQLLDSGRQLPLMRVNGDDIPWSALEGTLRQHFQKGDEEVILLKADRRLRFGQVVQVIDTCRAMGAKVVLDPPAI